MNKEFEKIIEKLEEYKYENLVEHDYEQSQHCKDIGDCEMRDCVLCVFDKAIEIVKQEAEKYNNGWIPCSERLPDDFMSFEYLTIRKGHTFATISYYCVANRKWYSSRDSSEEIEVVAWQPLPLPFSRREK